MICGLSKDGHFVKNPIVLTNCGHHVCKSCLPDKCHQTIKCNCGVITERDFTNDSESLIANHMIKIVLSSLFEEIENKTYCKVIAKRIFETYSAFNFYRVT